LGTLHSHGCKEVVEFFHNYSGIFGVCGSIRISKSAKEIPIYKSAKEMALPGMLSRAPLPETDEEMEKEINLHVHLVSSTLPASEFKLQEIREATKSDEELRTLLNII
jgi:hypothetical protein